MMGRKNRNRAPSQAAPVGPNGSADQAPADSSTELDVDAVDVEDEDIETDVEASSELEEAEPASSSGASELPPDGGVGPEDLEAAPAEPPPAAPPVDEARPGFVRCRVIGAGSVFAAGRTYHAGDEGDFSAADAESLPDQLEPIQRT